MIRRLLCATAVLLLASQAQASTINLLLTTDLLWPTVGPAPIGFTYEFFENPANDWLTIPQPQPLVLATGGGSGPGLLQFNISLDVDSLDDMYFRAWGGYQSFGPQGQPFTSLYSAQPPSGPVSDALVFSRGAPWIPLADLGDGISGDLRYFFGYSRGPIGTWEISAVQDPLTPVPEPASMLLFGSGLAAIAAKRYRRRKLDVD